MVNGFALPLTLTKQIVQRAGGNPFFIEEVVRSLFDQGAIVRREGGFEVTEKAHAITIPPTITDVLMARIDRLEEPTRHLVKVASVIGRSFFLRILSDVASEVEDIPGKLSFLSDIQLLQPQERMGEVEYLFKHALAQEAAYESLLPPRRRELHLKVAHSIEKIFSQRLPEFYGMLAYHYSRAEDREKTEEYLIKAGEEALRSAASDEALHYYKEALRLYLKKSGDDADPEKVAALEKNIALALYNRGQHEEALKYFNRALDYYWGRLPKNAVSGTIQFLSSILHFVTALYFPSLKLKGTPTQQDLESIDLFAKKCRVLAVINPRRFFIESFYFFKRLVGFDLRKIENGFGVFVGASPLFSFSGISFKLSRKILDFAKQGIGRDDVRSYATYHICETVHNYLGGNWKAIEDYDADLVKRLCESGEFFDASQLLYWHALAYIDQGYFKAAESILDKLDDIFKIYENDFSKIFKYELKTRLLAERRRFMEALIESSEGIDFEEKVGSGFWELHVFRACVYIAMGEIEKAEKCLQRAKEIWSRIKAVPFQFSSFCRSQLEYDLCRLKESIRNGNRAEAHGYRKKALESSKMLSRITRKVAHHRTESYKLTGEYYWLINKQKRALKRWHMAIKEGERLGARLHLARVYFEVGKRLLESGDRYKMLDAITAEEYLEKARVLFEEMGLQSDLDELSRVTRD